MEDSGELRTEENKVPLDVVNKKRTLKTPAQLSGLENAYKEHKFPTDEMKARLAVQIGLTEKQISSWFCHRRLKDKKRDESYPNGRQDHSSVVIQDRGSGLRQDSCGSIKQGDYRNIDPREVESRRICGQDFSASDLKYKRRSHQHPYDDHVEDTSSRDQHFSGSIDPCDMQISSQLTVNRATTQINTRGSKSISYKPSGYLKAKGETENPVITAVKRQLGKHYKEEGPLLGIQFDPLPPGAFEFPSSKPVNEPVYVGDFRQTYSLDIAGVIKQKSLNIVTVHNSKVSSQDFHMEGAKVNTVHGLERRDRKSNQQLKQKPSLDIYNSSAGKTTLGDCKRNTLSSKFAIEKTGSSSFSNHPGTYGLTISSEQEKTWLHDDDKHTYKAPKNVNISRTSNSICGYGESPGTERGSSARTAKVEKLGGEWKTKRECPVRVNFDLKNELRVSRQVDVQFLQQDLAGNESHALLTNQTKGSSMDVSSSFSEDETAETDSSSD